MKPGPQGRAHRPQLFGSFSVSAQYLGITSPPSVGPPHVRKPPQSGWHEPMLQTIEGPHAVPQVPQFSPSVASVTHCPLHAVCGGGHAGTHCPATHTSVRPHAMSQAPQFARLVAGFTQFEPHIMRGVVHGGGVSIDASILVPVSSVGLDAEHAVSAAAQASASHAVSLFTQSS